jgi:hypothetical protein
MTAHLESFFFLQPPRSSPAGTLKEKLFQSVRQAPHLVYVGTELVPRQFDDSWPGREHVDFRLDRFGADRRIHC